MRRAGKAFVYAGAEDGTIPSGAGSRLRGLQFYRSPDADRTTFKETGTKGIPAEWLPGSEPPACNDTCVAPRRSAVKV